MYVPCAHLTAAHNLLQRAGLCCRRPRGRLPCAACWSRERHAVERKEGLFNTPNRKAVIQYSIRTDRGGRCLDQESSPRGYLNISKHSRNKEAAKLALKKRPVARWYPTASAKGVSECARPFGQTSCLYLVRLVLSCHRVACENV